MSSTSQNPSESTPLLYPTSPSVSPTAHPTTTTRAKPPPPPPATTVPRTSPSLLHNLLLTTAPLAQIGLLVLLTLISLSLLYKPANPKTPYLLFDLHPIFNTLLLVLLVQGILVLQPTGKDSPLEKSRAAKWHAHTMGGAIAFGTAAAVVVVVHKIRSGIPHLESLHSKFGLATYTLLLIQLLTGVTQRYIPSLYGGEDKAKAFYRYHRMTGYALILPLILLTIILATKTQYATSVLGLRTWAVVLAAVAVVGGVYTRIRIEKFRRARNVGRPARPVETGRASRV
ncbi:hypothetical protein DFH27DRAFT_97113 [Peziza echinospora]|nr:hypothetical protein DFH27DRAFT_97113 [Peziza echinospora]